MRTSSRTRPAPAQVAQQQGRRLTPYWRWLGIGARAVHMATVVLLGATVLGAAPRVPLMVTGALLLASGAALLALETWKSPRHLVQFAGAGMAAKLLVVVWMLLDPAHVEVAFWLIVLWSVVFAHAPASFRHQRIDFWRA